MRRVVRAMILMTCVLATACNTTKPVAADKANASKPLPRLHGGTPKARSRIHKRPEDPEYQRLLERARRWKEQQDQLRRHPPYPSPIHRNPDLWIV